MPAATRSVGTQRCPLPLLGSSRASHPIRTALASSLGRSWARIVERSSLGFSTHFFGDASQPPTTGVGLFGEEIRFHSPPRQTTVGVGLFGQGRGPLGGSRPDTAPHSDHAGVLAARRRACEHVAAAAADCSVSATLLVAYLTPTFPSQSPFIAYLSHFVQTGSRVFVGRIQCQQALQVLLGKPILFQAGGQQASPVET